MSDLPSFRPRSAIGHLEKNGLVVPSREFLSWLDLLARQADTGAAIPASVGGLLMGVYPQADTGAQVAPAAYVDQGERFDAAEYTPDTRELIFAEYT